ncbi:MAG: hypothetical protein UX60_C0001G0003 [Berkelbacteria bacterium GW2011_GWA2_46_7]|uniref:Cell filamentation protein Fic n=2 Tax=Bacteria candidate phyla TaxID=1783234 RepID=A0A1F5Z3Y0_9BACT|nr:MAG: hypothetical protein UX60_C0001G0003 [Berkelbacteria bacterium GW2011_GWA2_46_7]OGG07136.1 MAG: cell filamentation protein Fic [Candidatus Gottesmanbacteria bacterium RIFCSPHIGHO2_01_FULL_42_12]
MTKSIIPHESEFLFYAGPDGRLHIDVFYADETVWLTQKRMAELFDVEVQTINYHLKEVFDAQELAEATTIRKFRIVQTEGGRQVEREANFYNLDAIISVGYRVNSSQATWFRQWATTTLREFMIRGFVLDDERLKNGSHFGKDYFEELLERIREIRLSERRLHLKITDIFETSSDYQPNSEIAKNFFAFVQNKLHWAITGQTAAELIHTRADAEKPNMGLTSWKQSPKGKIVKSDTVTAKNYLTEKELGSLRRIVSAFLDLSEDRAERRIVMSMKDWAQFIDQYLKLNSYGVLSDSGSVSHAKAVKKAAQEYGKFRPIQDQNYISDFEKTAKRLNEKAEEKKVRGDSA